MAGGGSAPPPGGRRPGGRGRPPPPAALPPARPAALAARGAGGGGQAYLGLSPPAAAQLLPLFMWGGESCPVPARCSAADARRVRVAVALVVCLAFPGVHAATEAASERARDFLSGASLSGAGGRGRSARSDADPPRKPPEPFHRRRRRGLRAGLPPRHPRRGTDFRSPWFDAPENRADAGAGRLLLALPFAPFILLGRRAGQARALRGRLTTRTAVGRSAPCSATSRAIGRPIFPVSAGLPFRACRKRRICRTITPLRRYVGLRAAYSDAPITQAERDGLKNPP